MKQDYFTEEELEAFIQEVEADSKTAPFYLKSEIMEKAKAMETDTSRSVRVLEEHRSCHNKKLTAKQRRTWMLYNCKIVAAAAAAIVMLFLFPVEQPTKPVSYEQNGMNVLSYTISEKTQELSSRISIFFNKGL